MSLRHTRHKRIVRVIREKSPDGKIRPAKIYERNKTPIYQYLSGDVIKQLGDDESGYFEADRIGALYYIEKRQKGWWSW